MKLKEIMGINTLRNTIGGTVLICGGILLSKLIYDYKVLHTLNKINKKL